MGIYWVIAVSLNQRACLLICQVISIWLDSNSVIVFTSCGQYLCKYGQTQIQHPRGIVIDSAGYSLVTSYRSSTLSIFDPSGKFIHSIGGFKNPCGVSLSPDGSVWVVDTGNNRLVKYCKCFLTHTQVVGNVVYINLVFLLHSNFCLNFKNTIYKHSS